MRPILARKLSAAVVTDEGLCTVVLSEDSAAGTDQSTVNISAKLMINPIREPAVLISCKPFSNLQ